MNETKFKAWDETKGRFIDDKDKIAVTLNGDIVYLDEDCPNCAKRNDLELLQYTGLKDVNGVEIYEGHIIEYDGVKRVVIKEDAGYKLDNDLGTDDFIWTVKNLGVGVVGDRFQNPELLR